MIDRELLERIRAYIQRKTGKIYFKHIKPSANNISVTCPFHKDGQESRPSCSIRVTEDEYSAVGTVHCFTCGVTMSLSDTIKEILGPLYSENEVETLFSLKQLELETKIVSKTVVRTAFSLPKQKSKQESTLKTFRFYHPYLESRRISKEVAEIYDIGFDKVNNHITFPIRDKERNCLGIGRRSIDKKIYRYPYGMIKPVYGVYELSSFLRYVWVAEGPFNVWSLKGWGKEPVGLLGTGTETQYKELLTIKCDGFVLALDPDDAGYKGIYKLGKFLTENHKKVFVALIPTGKDINDLQEEEFRQLEVVTYKEWLRIKHSTLVQLQLISSN